MGVDGLLSFVGSSLSDAHISRFRGSVVAVDASCWLHRGAHACADDIALGRSLDHERFLGFALRMIRLLQSHGVTPLCVFDGGKAPMKEATSADRHDRRAAELDRGRSLLEDGRTADASIAFGRAVTVTPLMARRLIGHLRRMRLPYVVAPFEADAQMAFLVQRGHCAAAITEDSDLLVYQCPATLFKLDATGHGRLALFENLQFADSGLGGQYLFDGAGQDAWAHWQRGRLVDMVILAGCDYVPGLPGVGLKTAHALLRTHRTLDACLRAQLTGVDRAEIDELVAQAQRVHDTFTSSWCYDPSSRSVVMMHTHSRHASHEPAMRHLGPAMDAALADAICIWASVDPITLEDAHDLVGLPSPVPLPPAAAPLRTDGGAPVDGALYSTAVEGADDLGRGRVSHQRDGARGANLMHTVVHVPNVATATAARAESALKSRDASSRSASRRLLLSQLAAGAPGGSGGVRVSPAPVTSDRFLDKFRTRRNDASCT